MTVDLADLINTFSLDKKALAKVLFPKYNYPDHALRNCIAKKILLDEQQLFALSTFTGLPVDALYKSSAYWKATTELKRIRFTNGEYTGLYDHETGIVKILHLEKQIATHVIAPKVVTLTEFLQSINQIIVKQSIQKP